MKLTLQLDFWEQNPVQQSQTSGRLDLLVSQMRCGNHCHTRLSFALPKWVSGVDMYAAVPQNMHKLHVRAERRDMISRPSGAGIITHAGCFLLTGYRSLITEGSLLRAL